MTTRKKKKINIEVYKKLLSENKLLPLLEKELQKNISFPIANFLEIGTGTADFMTKFFIKQEREKNIEKFYAMEPVDEYFEESKRHVVRLSRTDATTQEYFGGNPFDYVFIAFVINHILPDFKFKFFKNIRNNMSKNSRLLLVDSFIQDYKDEDGRKLMIDNYFKDQIDYTKKTDQKFLMKYFQDTRDEQGDDFLMGNYKISMKELVNLLEKTKFRDIQVKLFEGKAKFDWQKLGYYIISAIR